MIYGKSRNVIVIQNIDSGYVEQAILILKKNPGEKEFYASEEGIVKEAQRIIEQYNQANVKPQESRPDHLKLGWLLLGVSAVVSCALFYLIF